MFDDVKKSFFMLKQSIKTKYLSKTKFLKSSIKENLDSVMKFNERFMFRATSKKDPMLLIIV